MNNSMNVTLLSDDALVTTLHSVHDARYSGIMKGGKGIPTDQPSALYSQICSAINAERIDRGHHLTRLTDATLIASKKAEHAIRDAEDAERKQERESARFQAVNDRLGRELKKLDLEMADAVQAETDSMAVDSIMKIIG